MQSATLQIDHLPAPGTVVQLQLTPAASPAGGIVWVLQAFAIVQTPQGPQPQPFASFHGPDPTVLAHLVWGLCAWRGWSPQQVPVQLPPDAPPVSSLTDLVQLQVPGAGQPPGEQGLESLLTESFERRLQALLDAAASSAAGATHEVPTQGLDERGRALVEGLRAHGLLVRIPGVPPGNDRAFVACGAQRTPTGYRAGAPCLTDGLAPGPDGQMVHVCRLSGRGCAAKLGRLCLREAVPAPAPAPVSAVVGPGPTASAGNGAPEAPKRRRKPSTGKSRASDPPPAAS